MKYIHTLHELYGTVAFISELQSLFSHLLTTDPQKKVQSSASVRMRLMCRTFLP